MKISSLSLVSLAAFLAIGNSLAQDEPSSTTAADSATSQATPSATATSTSSANGFSIVLPFGTIVFTKFPFFITIGHAETKTSGPTPLAPITKSLAPMNICDAVGSSKFPDSCLQLSSETSGPSAAIKRHKRGLFDIIKPSSSTVGKAKRDGEEENSKSAQGKSSNSNDSANSDVTQIPLGSLALDSSSLQPAHSEVAMDNELNNIAWSGIDSAESSSWQGTAASSMVSEESGVFDIPKGNFLLTPESESERPAAASPAATLPSSVIAEAGIGPTTLIFVESSITLDLVDSSESHIPLEAPATGRGIGIEQSLSLLPLSELQSAIVSAQLSSSLSAKGVFSASAFDVDIVADPSGMQKGLVAECVSGMMRCAPDNLSFDTCLFGKWGTVRACAKGTSCITLPEHSIACA